MAGHLYLHSTTQLLYQRVRKTKPEEPLDAIITEDRVEDVIIFLFFLTPALNYGNSVSVVHLINWNVADCTELVIGIKPFHLNSLSPKIRFPFPEC